MIFSLRMHCMRLQKAVNEHPDAEVIYTDEDKVTTDLKEHFQPHLKPDFNLDLLRSNNYICHFFVASRDLIKRVGGFRPEFNGAQDYDLILRCTGAGEADCAYSKNFVSLACPQGVNCR